MTKKKIIIASTTVILVSFIILSFRFFSVLNFYSPHLSYLLGQKSPTTYLFLLGNDTEMRANGGFAGSYAKITTNTPHFDSLSFFNFKFFREMKIDFSFHDIYVPAGQIGSFVKPPDPVQQAFGKGSWDLSNADFNPHFPSSAISLRWFFEKGKEINPDVLGVVNLSTIKEVLNIIGPINLPGGDITITPDNLYLYLQGKAEVNFFPGSTQKADALHSVGSATLKKINSLSFFKKIQIAKILYQDLHQQNIVLNSTNPDFQDFLEKKNFAGVYEPKEFDHYGLVELNLGANKANQFVTRQTNHKVSLENNLLKHEVTIDLQNTSPEKNPNPPIHYGGHYLAYFRIFLPSTTTNIKIDHSKYLPCETSNTTLCYQATSSANVNQTVLENQTPNITNCALEPNTIESNAANQEICSFNPKGFTVISFWHLTLAGQHSSINLSYNLPPIDPKQYSLAILKQNGFPRSPHTLSIFGKTVKTNLEQRLTYP